jgi:hypothetical protein
VCFVRLLLMRDVTQMESERHANCVHYRGGTAALWFPVSQVCGVNTSHKHPGLAASKHTKLSTFISRYSHVCSQHTSAPQSEVRHVPT